MYTADYILLVYAISDVTAFFHRGYKVKYLSALGACFSLIVGGVSADAGTSAASHMPPHLLAAPPPGQRVIVIYRLDKSPQQLTLTYGGRLHASLDSGEFTLLSVCDSDVRVGAMIETKSVTQPRSEHVVDFSFQKASPLFVRMDLNSEQALTVVPVGAEAVPWSALEPHARIHSRVQLNCPVPVQTTNPPSLVPLVMPPVDAKLPPVPTLLLSADQLFAFGSTTLDQQSADIHIHQALRRHMQRTGIRNITSVDVYGHSDPVGSPERKEEVSRLRAEAVAQYLVGVIGVAKNNIRVEWKSDSHLLVAACPKLPVPARNVCNAPNRRVELFVSGTP